MHTLIDFLSLSHTAASILTLAITILSGLVLGSFKYRNIGLGVAGVLFSGLLISYLGWSLDEELLHFIKEFGLILFVFSVGLQIGPGFFSSLRSNGLYTNLIAVGVVLLGFVTAGIIITVTDLPVPAVAGILCGAVTNTPSLGAAQQLLLDQGGELAAAAGEVGAGYAVAYPFGIVGIILSMLLIRALFRIQLDREIEQYQTAMANDASVPQTLSIKVSNPLIVGKPFSTLQQLTNENIVMSRLLRNGETMVPTVDMFIEAGDQIQVVVDKQYVEALQLTVGEVAPVDLRQVHGKLASRKVVVTNRDIGGKSIAQINIFGRYHANITRIYRMGLEFIPNLNTRLEIGDKVRIVGEATEMDAISQELGDKPSALHIPNTMALFIGVLLGVLLGSIPVFLPGLPAAVKLGLAGGPLLVAILLSRLGHFGKVTFFVHSGASLFLRELGILLFLACVGLGAGPQFGEAIVSSSGWQWMVAGAMITMLPLFIMGSIARKMGFNYLSICGLLAGSMTDPPALEFANTLAPTQAQSVMYATVYPLVMFLRVLGTQIFLVLML